MSFYSSLGPSSYRSSRLSRSLRSSSVLSDASSYGSTSSNYGLSSSNYGSSLNSSSYLGVMPFNKSLEAAESRLRTRASSIEPVSTYRRSYSALDARAMDYARALDDHETNRDVINHLKYDHGYQPVALDNYSPLYADRVRDRRRMSVDMDAYRVDSRDLHRYKHYRKSTQTLLDRNSRAVSPMHSREIDRYFNTGTRSSFLGDVSSGGQRDFRYYNYRAVPYYGGSDYYSMTSKWRPEKIVE